VDCRQDLPARHQTAITIGAYIESQHLHKQLPRGHGWLLPADDRCGLHMIQQGGKGIG
jgi:hypothetical protein